jgi:hypothetical protein
MEGYISLCTPTQLGLRGVFPSSLQLEIDLKVIVSCAFFTPIVKKVQAHYCVLNLKSIEISQP